MTHEEQLQTRLHANHERSEMLRNRVAELEWQLSREREHTKRLEALVNAVDCNDLDQLQFTGMSILYWTEQRNYAFMQHAEARESIRRFEQ